MAERFENILIIKPSSLGDIVMTLPALTALRNSFQNARISWLVRPEFAPLIEKHPHLNETILFDRNRFGTAWYNPLALASLMSLIRNLRRRDFDAVFDFQGLFRTASLAWLTGCKKRFGMKNAREFAYLFYTHTVLIPGAARPYKLWPLDRFAAVADKLASQFGLSIAATGAAHEYVLIESLKSLTNVPITNLAGRTDLRQLTALLKNAKIVISNDTGPGHIAVALGTPLVMIFGRSNPIRLFPYGRPECTAAVEPFDRGNAINNYESKYDIKAVTVDDVLKKACKQIEHTPLTSK
jgi:ADP-heptose:LPS heptosyltransferase